MMEGTSRRKFIQTAGAAALAAGLSRVRAGEELPKSSRAARRAAVLEAPQVESMKFGGPLGERLAANVREWLLVAPRANPAMLQMFRGRDRRPPRDLVPWAGEFAGKYLISAVQALCMGGGAPLREHLTRFVAEMIATQAESGYMGPFPSAEKMMGKGRWDLWGQYHCMLGLLTW